MIARQWRGLARADAAAEYVHHLRSRTFPALRKLPGFVDASILSRAVGAGVEFLIVTRWDSPEVIARFAGVDPEAAVVPAEVARLMMDYDRRATHFEVMQDATTLPGINSSRDVIIRTERWPEALRFYEAVLGFTVASRAPAMAGFDTGAFRLYVEPGEPHGPVFDFLVADVEATKARLLAAGCTLLEEDPQVPRCYLRDPFGLVFNLGRAQQPAG